MPRTLCAFFLFFLVLGGVLLIPQDILNEPRHYTTTQSPLTLAYATITSPNDFIDEITVRYLLPKAEAANVDAKEPPKDEEDPSTSFWEKLRDNFGRLVTS